MTDLELLEAWASGDSACGGVLLKRYFDPLYRFFCNKLGRGADDLIQNTMLACVRGRDKFRGDGSFRAFMFAVARHELLHHLRSQRRDRLVFEPEIDSVQDIGVSPSSVVAAKKEQTLLLIALRSIPVALQVALELHYWEDLSTREMAVALGIPQGTVKSRIRRARALLEAQIVELADTPQRADSTINGLDAWAEGLRGGLTAPRRR